jgi:FKBP-type peptidyl-prolyl cis-trans isomerase 2
MEVKKGDFVEIDYVGKVKNDDKIFDLTDEKLAKEKGIFNSKFKYGPVIVCIGQGQIIKNLDEELVGKDKGEYKIDLSADKAFGKKDAKKVRIISMASFKNQKVNPYPGLQIDMNGMMGLVRSVTGGRVVVDFNHPLAGKDLVYEIKINRIVTDPEEKVKGLLSLLIGMKEEGSSYKEGVVEIKANQKVPEPMEKIFTDKIKELIPEVKQVKFIEEKESPKKATTLE